MSYPDSLPSNGVDDEPGKNDKELIVVASLLDKAPNLAGLSRTCEVPFTGLSPLYLAMVGLLRIEFLSLSWKPAPSSIAWIPRDAVPTNQRWA